MVPTGGLIKFEMAITTSLRGPQSAPAMREDAVVAAHAPASGGAVDLGEALRLLGLDGPPLAGADEVARLQHVIDGLCLLSSHDGLTGLANRRVFNDALGREIDRGARTAESFGLLIIDIDHFKQINDQHGHPVGDLVLKAVAEKIADSFRSIDLVARFGGEEFAVVLPNVSPAFLLQVAERAREAVANTRVEGPRGLQLNVTVSIGAVCARGLAAIDRDALIEDADSKLYAAKRQGRNRVCFDTAPDTEVTLGERAHLLRLIDSPDTIS